MTKIDFIESKVLDWKDLKYLLTAPSGECTVVGYLNPFTASLLYKDQVEPCDYYALDGVIATRLFNIFNRKSYRTLSFDFSHVAGDVFELAQSNKLNVAIIGAKDDELARFIDILRSSYTELNIGYTRNGYFSSDEEMAELVASINASKPDVVILSLGTPLQEKVGCFLKSRVNFGLTIIACGAFVSQTASSGSRQYYPAFVDLFSLRWLYRLYKEKHIRKRWLIYYPRFLASYPLLKVISMCKRFFV